MNYIILFCSLFNRFQGEKSAYAAYHLLRGKRSGQTIQDVNYYHLKKYFALLPTIKKSHFDSIVQKLLMKEYIKINEEGLLTVTEKGKERITGRRTYYFNGWNYRGRENLFFARLSLIVQTLSNIKNDVNDFMPVQKDIEVQQFVKGFLTSYPMKDSRFIQQIKNEIEHSIIHSQMSDVQKTIFTHRLVGYQITGWTWEQLAIDLEMDSFDVKLYFIESLHMLLQVILQSKQYPLLQKIAHEIQITNHLTNSTMQTKHLFNQGLSIEEMASIRRLKVSTIEDHLVEIALNDVFFPFERFVAKEHIVAVQQASHTLNTKRLRRLKELFPQLSYFQIRLILSAPAEEVVQDQYL